jgi:acetate---CoA ligase (ADP-forming)
MMTETKRENLRVLFWPRSLAIVGASNREGTVGRELFSNVLMNGYTGVVYPVHLTAKSILGVKAYPSTLHIPDEVDMAVIIVPAVAVPATLEECGQKGVKAAIVISAGFKEMGEQGKLLERKVKEKADKYNIAMVGPNCFGMINTDARVRMNATFGRVMPQHGNIAFVSQSGALGIAALEFCQAQEIGLSKFVSIGNKADINENDLLTYLRDDDETDVILLYLEDLANPREFMDIARGITGDGPRTKPILAIKSGRTTEGARAASSHTGALAGSDAAYDAFFEQCGILRVESLNDLFENAIAFSRQPVPKGNRVAIITNAGGAGIMATDAAIHSGLKLAELSVATKQDLRAGVPVTASVNNPVDVLGDADAERYSTALRKLLNDPNVDGAITIWTPTLMAETKSVAEAIARVAPESGKPVMGCLMSLGNTKEIAKALGNIPSYTLPETAVKAMSRMAYYGLWLNRPRTGVKSFSDVKTGRVREIIANVKSRPRRFVAEPEGHEILSCYGLPVLPSALVKTGDEAVAAAATIGYPVVIKIVSPDILHKTEFGGVRVNIKDETALRSEFATLMDTVKAKAPDADVWGVFVQKMAAKGREFILGMNRDPQFGPLIMFGMGGIMVELLKDVAFRVAPVRELSAQTMITEIKGYKLITGFRGAPPADRDTIVESIERLSQMAIDFPEINEVDINPFVAYDEGEGACALDARILIK